MNPILIKKSKKFLEDIEELGGMGMGIEQLENGVISDGRSLHQVKDNARINERKFILISGASSRTRKVIVDEVREHDYILTPDRYVGIENEDGEPFEEKMTRLTVELVEQFAKSKKLEQEIRKRLGGIGYEL
jgi:type I restriction-modification system DNA methylase subunit